MKWKSMLKECERLSGPFRVTHGSGFRLKEVEPDDTLWLKDKDKDRAKEALSRGIETLAAMQEKLYAQDRWSVLLIFQAMDAAGKDGAIKHVMSGVNPQGCQVFSFKAPTTEELDHDFLWRCLRRLPERGRIGIFNRSYYEEVLVVRVHRALLAKQKLPGSLVGPKIWRERCEDIRNVEQYLGRNGVRILKFFLHVSKGEQKERFLERLNDPAKHWKFSAADVAERGHWKDYMKAYEDMIRQTATREAPWYVVPADHKWFTRLVVAAAVIKAMSDLNLNFPQVSKDQMKELAAARKVLAGE